MSRNTLPGTPLTRFTTLTRRRLLGGGLAALAGAGLTACGDDAGGSDGPAETGIEEESGPWTYTDDLGQVIELDERPTRIAAYGDAATALMGFGITPVAIFHYVDPAEDPAFDGLDLTGIPVVGTQFGDIDLERLLGEIVPDLVITTAYRDNTPDDLYGFKDATQIEKIRKVSPIVAIMQQGSALDVIGANQGLAAALGVDVDGGQVAADRADFEAASAELRDAAADGPSVVAVFADDSGLWYAKAPDDPALSYYASLGVRFADVPGDTYYWETVSWENADTIQTDVVLYSERTSYSPEQLMARPIFAGTPAARAGQLHPWKFMAMSYPAQARYLRELAGWLAEDRQVT